MEIKKLNMASWYASYMVNEQGEALIRCQEEKIKQLTSVIENIKGEIELTKEPKEYNSDFVLSSVEALINQIKQIEYTVGHFKWIG